MSMTRISAIDILVKASWRDFISEEEEALRLIHGISSGEEPSRELLNHLRFLEQKCTSAAEKHFRKQHKKNSRKDLPHDP